MENESLHVKTTPSVILYVDDQPSHRALFKKAFEAKYEVLTASSGEEGLEIIKGREIFLVIADHNMPGMTGIDFLEKTEHFSPKSQRAILSAYLDTGIAKEARRRLRPAELLEKPWKLDRMRGFIQQAYDNYAIQRAEAESQIHEPEAVDVVYQPPVTSAELAKVIGLIGDTVDPHGARRIFLNFVQPKLKENIPLIRRPYPDILRKAQKEALSGDFDAFQKLLSLFLKEEGIGSILQILSDRNSKTVN